MTSIERATLPILLDIIRDPKQQNVILIEGARQCGKTTIIKQALNKLSDEIKIIDINLELDLITLARIDETKEFADFQSLLMSDYSFNPEQEQVLFIDEAQESKMLGAYVRFMKEKWPNTCCILTGSSMTRLFREDQRIPVGRYSRYKVNPFSFSEFLLANGKEILLDMVNNFSPKKGITHIFHEDLLTQVDLYLQVGGLPEIVTDFVANRNYDKTRKSILLSQEEDFLRKSELNKEYLFMDAMKAVANHLGSSSNYSHVTDKIYDAKNILHLLSDWHLVNEIEQKNNATTTKFHPKRYVYDIGMAHELRSIPFPKISLLNTTNPALRTQLGGLFENLVLLELQNYNMDFTNLSSWKKNSKENVEVDFIWQGFDSLPIECKASLKVTNRLSSLKSYFKQTETSLGLVISAAPYEEFDFDRKKIINIPIYLANPHIMRRLVEAI